MKRLTKKEQLRNRVNKATERFLKSGGKIKKVTVPSEVDLQTNPFSSFADFMLMENQQFQVFQGIKL